MRFWWIRHFRGGAEFGQQLETGNRHERWQLAAPQVIMRTTCVVNGNDKVSITTILGFPRIDRSDTWKKNNDIFIRIDDTVCGKTTYWLHISQYCNQGPVPI